MKYAKNYLAAKFIFSVGIYMSFQMLWIDDFWDDFWDIKLSTLFINYLFFSLFFCLYKIIN